MRIRLIKAVGAAAALVLGLTLAPGAVEPAEAGKAGKYNVKNEVDKGTTSFRTARFMKDTLIDIAKVRLVYKTGYPSDVDNYMWVKPTLGVSMYNADGSHMTCNSFTRRLDGFTFRWYFWQPARGTNWASKPIFVPCEEGTINAVPTMFPQRGRNAVPRFYYGPGYGRDKQPKWKVVITQNRNGSPDVTKSITREFNPLN